MKNPKEINVLIACEESQAVCLAFRKLGFNAYSNDVIECSGGHPEFHLKMDCFEAIKLKKWDLMIGHPPCTHLAVSGACHFKHKQKVQSEAITFFMNLYYSDIEYIAIENPVCIMSTHFRKPDQIINPYNFGTMERKRTCLWLKNLPKLKETNNVKEPMLKLPYKEYAKIHYCSPGPERAKIRSKTYKCFAEQFALQWGEFLIATL